MPRIAHQQRPSATTGLACWLLLLASGLLFCDDSQLQPAVVPLQKELLLPPRPAGAPSGSEFIHSVTGMEPRRREVEIRRQLAAGNVPGFLRRLLPVDLSTTVPGRGQVTARIWVTPDYLAIGSDDDFVRMPMSYYSACAVARAAHCVLPTRKMVNAIYRQADVRLAPLPMKPGPTMRSSGYYQTHNALIEQQLAGRGGPGVLVAGCKKDLVLSNRLWTRNARVAIYGWQRLSGEPIQPLSTVHGATYADYSHGVRLVSESVVVDGVSMEIVDVLADPALARLLTSEGVIRDARGLLERTTPPAPSPAPARSGT